MNTITWLHLSDLHACNPNTGWDSKQVTDSLQTDLKRMENDYGLRPDILFFTGDIAYGDLPRSSIDDQYLEAREFINQVRMIYSEPIIPENIFIVPGNHDVNRSKIGPEQTIWFDEYCDIEKCTLLIQQNDLQWQRTMERLINYRMFLFNSGYTHLLKDKDRLIYSIVRIIKGNRIGIVGFNSSWSCGREKEKGKLWFAGKWQISHLYPEIANTDISIALIHHPSNWFVMSDDSQVNIALCKNFNFLLHGHEHLNWIDIKDKHIRIAAAACYDRSERDNGYNIVRLNIESGICEIWFRKYDGIGGAWVPRPIAHIAEDGKCTIDKMDWLKNTINYKRCDTAISSKPLVNIDETYKSTSKNVLNISSIIELKGYTIKDELGSGSFGRVYLIEQINTGFKYALKIFTPSIFDKKTQGEAYTRFIRGIKIMENLVHPGIVRINQIIDEGIERCCYLMDYYALGSLKDLLNNIIFKRVEISLQNKIEIVIALCETIAYTHERFIIHRDIKPSNILIDQDSETGMLIPVLSDFDLAFRKGEATITYGDMGSIYFLPPEIRSDISRQDIHFLVDSIPSLRARTEMLDIYATGGILYYLLTYCYPPLETVDFFREFKKLISTNTNPQEKTILKAMSVVLSKVLSPNFDERPVSITKLKELIQEAISSPTNFEDDYKNIFETEYQNRSIIGEDVTSDSIKQIIKWSDIFLDLTDVGIFIIEKGRVIYANNNANILLAANSGKEILHIPIDELITKVINTNIKFSDLEKTILDYSSRNNDYSETLDIEINFKIRKTWIVHGKKMDIDKKNSVIIIFEDITEKRMLEEQFRQAQKMESVGRLAGGIAHDFNNLLTVISGNTELAMMNLHDNDPMRHDLNQIQKAAIRASKLTGQLLAFSRRQRLQPKIHNLNTIVLDMEKMLHRMIREDIELETILQKDLWNTIIDSGQFEQILMNLSVNARDAMPGSGKLIIETMNVQLSQDYCDEHRGFIPGDYVVIAVSDTGCGMSEETKSKIFEPFFTTKPAGEGTGLGLATVFGIVKQSDGFINFCSEIGQGTTFKIYLPRNEQTVDAVVSEEIPDEKLYGKETILVVEDEEGVRNIAVKTLKKFGYNALEAENGRIGYLKCKNSPESIDLVVTDLIMPEMNGKEFIHSIKENKPNIKVLYMSGYTCDILIKQDIIVSEADFISKPFDPLNLVRKVREILNR